MRKAIVVAMLAVVAGCAYDRGSECDEPSARWMELLGRDPWKNGNLLTLLWYF